MNFSTPRPLKEIVAELNALRADSERIIFKIDSLVTELKMALLLLQSTPSAWPGANRHD